MKRYCFLSLLLFLFAYSIHAEAAFSNNGRMQSTDLNLSIGGTLDNDGELIGVETAKISCETLTGKGLIRAPDILIKAKFFAFTGTIDCSNTCTIITSAPFNEAMCQRTGGGEWIVIIHEAWDTPLPLSQPLLQEHKGSLIIQNCQDDSASFAPSL